MKKKSKIKEYYKNFKELWEHPRYRALIKLSLYGIMFLIIIVTANLYQDISSNKKTETEQTKTYTEIINSINLENCDIVYTIKTPINSYKLEGKIKENKLSGYIEKDSIKKIIIKEDVIYQINNDIETIDTDLNNEILAHFLIPKNIIELVHNEKAYINKGIEETIYEFNITYLNANYEIKIVLNSETISNINIKNDQLEYKLELDFDKIS